MVLISPDQIWLMTPSHTLFSVFLAQKGNEYVLCYHAMIWNFSPQPMKLHFYPKNVSMVRYYTQEADHCKF